MKYRYVITCEGVVEADTEAQAKTAALWELDNGLQSLTLIEVGALTDRARAPLTKGEGENG